VKIFHIATLLVFKMSMKFKGPQLSILFIRTFLRLTSNVHYHLRRLSKIFYQLWIFTTVLLWILNHVQDRPTKGWNAIR